MSGSKSLRFANKNDIKVKKLRKRESAIDTIVERKVPVEQQIMMGHSLLCKVNELKKTEIKE